MISLETINEYLNLIFIKKIIVMYYLFKLDMYIILTY